MSLRQVAWRRRVTGDVSWNERGAEIGFETGRRMSFRNKKGTAPAGAGLSPGGGNWVNSGTFNGDTGMSLMFAGALPPA